MNGVLAISYYAKGWDKLSGQQLSKAVFDATGETFQVKALQGRVRVLGLKTLRKTGPIPQTELAEHGARQALAAKLGSMTGFEELAWGLRRARKPLSVREAMTDIQRRREQLEARFEQHEIEGTIKLEARELVNAVAACEVALKEAGLQ